MKKLSFTLVALLFAGAASAATICGTITEIAVIAAKAANAGVDLSVLSADLENDTKQTTLFRRQVLQTTLEIQADAYYSWSKFDQATIRQLAHSKCRLSELHWIRK